MKMELLVLPIVIASIIILAAITFSESEDTIVNAYYSKFVENISQMQQDAMAAALAKIGEETSNGCFFDNSQIYHWIATGSGELLTRSEAIEKEYSIVTNPSLGKLELKIQNSDGSMNTSHYAITNDGTVFIWPPFFYDGEYYVNIKNQAGQKDGKYVNYIIMMEKTILIDENEFEKLK